MIGCSKSHDFYEPIRVLYFSIAWLPYAKILLRHLVKDLEQKPTFSLQKLLNQFKRPNIAYVVNLRF